MPITDWEFVDIDKKAVDLLTTTLSVKQTIAQLLVRRGYREPHLAKKFLHPLLTDLHDPFELTDLDIAVGRILNALLREETVGIHGDYDVDGVVSTAILKRILISLGGNVIHFLPNRFTDGYGLQSAGIKHLHGLGASVIITVDCGIRSTKAAEEAKRLGIDLIVTDHHEPAQSLPPAFAVVNPRREDCAYPDKDLAGVGVTFKLIQALCIRTNKEHWLPSVLKLASIGTLADVVPLRGENRVISKIGLAELASGTHSQGIDLLLKTSGLTQNALSSDDVTFKIAPRINAAGRMSSADTALDLLLARNSDSLTSTLALATKLESDNELRKQTEAATVKSAIQLIDADNATNNQRALVVWGHEWHKGVIGIVASRLVDIYNKPAIVFSVGSELAHGSARGVSGFDVLSSLQRCRDVLSTYGGHKAAAGLTIKQEYLMEFKQRFVDDANTVLAGKTLHPSLTIDGELAFKDIKPQLVRDLVELEPFGNGNPRPIFYTGPVCITHGPRVLQSKHLKMTLEHKNCKLTALWWGGAPNLEFITNLRKNLHIAYSLAENIYRGQSHIQLSIADARKVL